MKIGLDDVGRRRLVVVVMAKRVVAGLVTGLVITGSVAGAEVSYKKDVKKVLKAKCTKCHGFFVKQKGLSLGSVKAILKGGESGPAAVSGKPSESLMIKALGYKVEDVRRMPPAAEKNELTAAEKTLLENWIRGGMK